MEEPTRSTIDIINEAHKLTCKTKANEEMRVMYRASKSAIKLIRGGTFPLPLHFPFRKTLLGGRASDSTRDSLEGSADGKNLTSPIRLPSPTFDHHKKCPFLSKHAAVI